MDALLTAIVAAVLPGAVLVWALALTCGACAVLASWLMILHHDASVHVNHYRSIAVGGWLTTAFSGAVGMNMEWLRSGNIGLFYCLACAIGMLTYLVARLKEHKRRMRWEDDY